MELLLNLLWLLLALPAYCLWRDARNSRRSGSPSPLQCLLALGCVLVLLFPVVSATDDLHAMRSEMEESSKRGTRQVATDRSLAGHGQRQHPPATVAAFASISPLIEARLEFHTPELLVAVPSFSVPPGRAPPVLLQ